jgi:hypothetical protein
MRVFIKCYNRDTCGTISPVIQKSQFSSCSPVSASLMESSSEGSGGSCGGYQSNESGSVCLIRPKAEVFGNVVDSPSPVGYRAPCRCKKCKPVTEHPSGISGPVSTPKVPTGFEYQGLRFPHFLRRSNLLSESSSGTTRRLWLPELNGYAGAVARRAGSAPVAVGPG